jgi:hypothetical protein
MELIMKLWWAYFTLFKKLGNKYADFVYYNLKIGMTAFIGMLLIILSLGMSIVDKQNGEGMPTADFLLALTMIAGMAMVALFTLLAITLPRTPTE